MIFYIKNVIIEEGHKRKKKGAIDIAKHIVKCLYCGERFDTSQEPTVKPTKRRYAHKRCAEEYEANMTQEQRDERAFYRYVQDKLGEDYNYVVTKRLANQYVKEYKYTYSGMLKSLIWFYDVQKNSTAKSNGSIGIIPYIYNNARDYYYAIWLAQVSNAKKDLDIYKEPDVIHFEIPSPRTQTKKKKLFDLGG